MSYRIILLETRAEMLEMAGYRVTRVGTPKAASRILRNAKVDLAILDIRLLDDDDEKDMSGLTVVKESQSPVPVARPVLDYAFGELALPRMDAAADNAASVRLLEKIGMQRLGHDEEGGHAFSLTRDEFLRMG